DQLNSYDLDLQFSKFSSIIKNCLNEAFPVKTITVSNKNKRKSSKDDGWVTAGIKTSSKKLKFLHRICKDGDENLKEYYKKYKALYKKVISSAKRMHNSNIINQSCNKTKKAWELISVKKSKKDKISLK